MSPYPAGLPWVVLCVSMVAGAVGQMYGAQGFALRVSYGLGIVPVPRLAGAPRYPLVGRSALMGDRP